MNYYKDQIKVLCERKGWDKVPVDTVWLLFTEEIGELASAIRQNKKIFAKRATQDVVLEMGDVFSYLFQLANMLDVDLDLMWELHREKMNKRNYFTTVH
jgi:NTP pyrophosphatase (non-canonical NTP hydrolase)